MVGRAVCQFFLPSPFSSGPACSLSHGNFHDFIQSIRLYTIKLASPPSTSVSYFRIYITSLEPSTLSISSSCTTTLFPTVRKTLLAALINSSQIPPDEPNFDIPHIISNRPVYVASPTPSGQSPIKMFHLYGKQEALDTRRKGFLCSKDGSIVGTRNLGVSVQ